VWRRAKLKFMDREIIFADRERALKQIEEIAERGTYPVYVVYGPEGCGKTALFKQAFEILESFGYYVMYSSPLSKEVEELLRYSSSLSEIVREVLKLFPEPYSRIADVVINIAGRAMKRFSKPRIAILLDDLFQAVGIDKAEIYAKALLNLIEYPSGDYDKIVVLVSSSEGVTRERVGRHRWVDIYLMWNMSRKGFEELYNMLPDPKPSPDILWAWTGGNPWVLQELYRNRWQIDLVIERFAKERKLRNLITSLDREEIEVLKTSLENPDIIFKSLRNPAIQKLEKLLIEMNLLIEIWDRDERLWIDVPPPEKDPELGISEYYAWQTPLHKEAVKRILIQIL